MGTKAAQTKSRSQTPMINTARPRPSADAYGKHTINLGFYTASAGTRLAAMRHCIRNIL